MRSSDERRATELREAHWEKVARNEVRDSPLWAQPPRGYNVQIELDPRAGSALGKIQRSLRQAEPNPFVCPEETLHVSLAWLLAVHVSYPVDKDSLWKRYGEEWTAELRRIAARNSIERWVRDRGSPAVAFGADIPAEPIARWRQPTIGWVRRVQPGPGVLHRRRRRHPARCPFAEV